MIAHTSQLAWPLIMSWSLNFVGWIALVWYLVRCWQTPEAPDDREEVGNRE